MEIQSIINQLSDANLYPDSPRRIEIIQTHISVVFISERFVYKVKKPVDFGFLDFTSLEKRKHFCEEELRLNQRISPQVYLGLQPIYEKDGGLSFEGPGEIVEYAVKMKKLPLERQMKRLFKSGKLGKEDLSRLAKKLAEFHRNAATGGEIDEYGSPRVVKFNTDENFEQTMDFIGRAIEKEQFDALLRYTNNFLAENEVLFQARIDAGKIRDCHGDLHMEHILFADEIVIFDCIEFTPRFRCGDVVAEIAFLAMDLDYHGAFELSDTLIEYYKDASQDREIDELLTFYKVYRAYVRGKVTSFQLGDPSISGEAKREATETARRYFNLAYSYIMPVNPVLIAVGGIMGSGKSTLSKGLCERLDIEMIRSDQVRKEMAGLPAEEHIFVDYGSDIYSPEFTAKVYEEVVRRAVATANQGKSVIIDASFKTRAQRELAAEAALEAKVRFVLLLCFCSEENIRKRLKEREDREGEISDGRLEILSKQVKDFAPAESAPGVPTYTIDTDPPPQSCLAAAIDLMAGLAC
jgi:aminoglycoside phosphotransferase family enzyme/predicted kinase